MPALLLAGCSSAPEPDPAIGSAFAGPSTLNLHKEIDPKSAVVGTARHGEKLEITAQRRRWYKVRTPEGATGWTEDRELLDTAQMERLNALEKETSGLPSQGTATTFDTLNIHAEPNRLSPSFVQVKEGEKFDVIAHRVFNRAPLPKRELVTEKPRPTRSKKKKKSEKSGDIPLPPPPPPPPLPADWVALSKMQARTPEEQLPPAAKDDWTLVRTQSGQSGWVLTSRVYMSIPDEVAQYAEGHRITSYFSLGKVTDGDEQKDIWLWTTAVSLGEDHDFDGMRIFGWNSKRHRYETTFIQRRLRGFLPVLVQGATFSVCLEQEDGARVRKRFSLDGHTVRLIEQVRCGQAGDTPGSGDAAGAAARIEIHEAGKTAGFWDGLKKRVQSFVGK